MVTFNQIPADIRTPGVYTEFDGSGALQGTPAKPHTALLIGLRNASGASIAAATPVQIVGKNDADGFFGIGSPLAEMARAFKEANPRTKLMAIALGAAGTALQKKITFTGPASADGTLAFYVAGKRYTVAITSGMTANQVAGALEDAITADPQRRFNAAVGGEGSEHEVTLTAKLAGKYADDIDLAFNRRAGDAYPTGVGATIAVSVASVEGADIEDAIEAFGDMQFDSIATMFNDASNLALLETELARRWGPMVSLEGHAFASIPGDVAALTSFASTRNSPHLTIMPMGKSPTPSWVMAAVVAAVDAGESDPGRPRHTLPLIGVEAPKPGQALVREDRDLLLHAGMSTYKVDPGGNVIIERLITTYQENALGSPDPTYLDITTMRTLAYLRYSWNLRLSIKYPRHKLADDGTNFAPGSKVVTPSVIRGEALAWFREMEFATHVEGFDQFKSDLIVARSASDPNRLDLVLNPDLVNQLGVIATQIGFRI